MIDIFASMPFGKDFQAIFSAIKGVASKRHLAVYRVDHDHLAESIRETIDRALRESRFVIADITGNNPNVLNEIGQARALGKPLILISQDAPGEAAFNVRGFRIHQYNRQDLDHLRVILNKALAEATTPNELLRSMLVPSSLGHPTDDSRFIIAASPLSYRRAMGRLGGYKRLRRTSSDYVGLRGVLQSFGLLYGFEALPDIVDPDDCDDGVIREKMSIYCIASPKTNRWTGILLDEYQSRWVPRLEFRADPSTTKLKNVQVALYADDGLLHPPGWKINSKGDRYVRDFGLIVRGPNPYHENQMVAILAGRSSLGTEAASRAFTDPSTIQKIESRLRGLGISIENHNQAFWLVASMTRATGDDKEEAIPGSLRIHQLDAFDDS